MDIDLNVLKDLSRSEKQKLQKLLTPKFTKYIPHTPTPKQAAFMLLDNKEAFYGGAAGGGKSDALLMCALQYVDVKGYSAIIFRKTYADLVKPGALIDRAKEWLFKFDDVRWDEKNKKFEFFQRTPWGNETISTLQFGYLENDNDRFNYQGGEYQFVGFDELTHISEVNYRYLFSRMRRLKGSNIPLRVRGAANPPDTDDGIWVYNRFVNPKTKEKDVIFIPAGLNDNPFLDAEEYSKALDALDPVTRARLKDGNWEVQRKGNMFKRQWFETVDAPPINRRRVRYWDMAATAVDPKKKNKDPDYTVGFLMSEAKGIYYIEDIVHTRVSAQQSQDLQRNTALSDGQWTHVREEQEPGSSGVNLIAMKARDIFRGFNYKGIKATGSKIQRAEAVSAASEQGLIKVVRGCRNLEAFFNEIETFPEGLHDDLVDGFSGAFNELALAPVSSIPEASQAVRDSYWTDGSNFGYTGGSWRSDNSSNFGWRI